MMDLKGTGILGLQGMAEALKRWPVLVEALEAIDLTKVEDQEDTLCRLLEAVLFRVRERDFKRAGWRRRQWDRGGPGAKRGAYDGGINAAWADHLERLTKEGHSVTYVSEPYNLSEDSILEIAELIADGWKVHISSWRARHYPGHTLALWFSRESKEAGREQERD